MSDGLSVTYVLVHGAGHGGWCWKRVANRLRHCGAEVYTPTLTGFGERRHLQPYSFATFVEDILNVFTFEDLKDVVLVGHSMAGIVIPRVALEIPERLRTVVWLAGPVTRDGESLVDVVPGARADAGRSSDPSPRILDALLDAMLPGAPPEDREFVRQRHLRGPKLAWTEPGRLTEFLRLDLPTAFLWPTEDAILGEDACRSFAALLPGARFESIDSGHDCMITHPDLVADALQSLNRAEGIPSP
jgi:pimeloyl-ACP methyl ester carboxylesterase